MPHKFFNARLVPLPPTVHLVVEVRDELGHHEAEDDRVVALDIPVWDS